MQKYCLSLVLLLLFLCSCQANQPITTTVQESSAEQSTASPKTEEEHTAMNEPSTAKLSTTVVWIEDGERPAIDDAGRTIGIRYSEVDLSKPSKWLGVDWDQAGQTVNPRGDLSQILGHSISTRDDAAWIADRILESELKEGNIIGGLKLELMQIERDSNKNIWIFYYWENQVNLACATFCVAFDGKSGEMLRMWVQGE